MWRYSAGAHLRGVVSGTLCLLDGPSRKCVIQQLLCCIDASAVIYLLEARKERVHPVHEQSQIGKSSERYIYRICQWHPFPVAEENTVELLVDSLAQQLFAKTFPSSSPATCSKAPHEFESGYDIPLTVKTLVFRQQCYDMGFGEKSGDERVQSEGGPQRRRATKRGRCEPQQLGALDALLEAAPLNFPAELRYLREEVDSMKNEELRMQSIIRGLEDEQKQHKSTIGRMQLKYSELEWKFHTEFHTEQGLTCQGLTCPICFEESDAVKSKVWYALNCGNKKAHVICETCYNETYYIQNPYCPFRCGTEGMIKRNVRTEAWKLHW